MLPESSPYTFYSPTVWQAGQSFAVAWRRCPAKRGQDPADAEQFVEKHAHSLMDVRELQVTAEEGLELPDSFGLGSSQEVRLGSLCEPGLAVFDISLKRMVELRPWHLGNSLRIRWGN